MQISFSTLASNIGELTEKQLAMIADAGFQAVEILGLDYHFAWHDLARVAKLAGWLAKYKLEPLSLHLPFYTGYRKPDFHFLSLSEPYEPWLREAMEAKVRLTQVAADLGCRLVVEHGPGDEYDEVNGNGTIAPPEIYERFTLAEARQLYRRSFAEYWERTEHLGLAVALENVMTRGSTVPELVTLCRELDNERIGLCLDIGHSHVSSHPLVDLKQGADVILALHVHDNHGRADDHLLPYAGGIDWPPVMKSIAGLPRLQAFTMELVYPGAVQTDEGLRQFINAVAAMAQKLQKQTITEAADPQVCHNLQFTKH